MKLAYFDGFDYRTSTNKGAALQTTDYNCASAYGRLGSVGARIQGGAGATCNLDNTDQVAVAEEITVGIAFYIPGDDPAGFNISLMNADEAPEQCLRLITLVNGKFRITRGDDGSNPLVDGDTSHVNGTTDIVIVQQSWYYLKWRVKLSSSTAPSTLNADGEIWLTLNGVEIYHRSAVKTKNKYGVLHYQAVRFQASPEAWVDDFVVATSHAGDVAAVPDDAVVRLIMPNAAGDQTDLAPSGGGNNYQKVDEKPPSTAPDGSDYNSSNVDGDVDLYNYEDVTLDAGAEIIAVQASLCVQKSASGVRGVAHMIKSGATTSEGSRRDVTDNLVYHRRIYETDPDTGDAWTESGLNAAQFGAKVKD